MIIWLAAAMLAVERGHAALALAEVEGHPGHHHPLEDRVVQLEGALLTLDLVLEQLRALALAALKPPRRVQ